MGAILARASAWIVASLAALVLLGLPARAAPADLRDNWESVAVVVGNKTYRQTSPVDYASNDADAMKDFLIRGLGFQPRNVLVLKDATLNELNLTFGSETNPQSGRLYRSAVAGRSNVFVYYSGHGVPDLKSRQPFLLPQDGDPNFAESGYALDTLYRNLELVKQKVGPDRQVIVMVDACFTGETGRKGENMLSVSAPGFAPAKPKPPGGVIRLAATSGATPANWDDQSKLGLFTSRFLMGAAGLAEEGGAKSTPWADLQAYVTREVSEAASRNVGREQRPEIDAAPLTLPLVEPGPAIRGAVDRARDEQAWRDADRDGSRAALERYVARCFGPCAYREQAMAKLLNKNRGDEALKDDELWAKLSAAGRYQDYLSACDKAGSRVCAYRQLALAYLGKAPTDAGPSRPQPDASRGRVDFGELPRRSAGLWESKMDGFEWSGTKECVGSDGDMVGSMAWKASAATCPYEAYKTADGFELGIKCGIGKMSADSKGVVSGDFDRQVTADVEWTVSSGVDGEQPTSAKLKTIWRKVGACKTGMKPGDTLMPNGKVVKNAQNN